MAVEGRNILRQSDSARNAILEQDKGEIVKYDITNIKLLSRGAFGSMEAPEVG